MLESGRSVLRMVCFEMTMNDGRIITMMIRRSGMNVLGGKRCQHGEAQGRDRRRQSARFEQEHSGLLPTGKGVSQHRQFCGSKTRTSAGSLRRAGTAT